MSGPASGGQLLMIGLDAAEASLIDQWTRDGSLPNLRRLREQGSFGPLESTAKWLVGSPWPTFFTGKGPSAHGLYHYLMWKASAQATTRPSPEWLPVDPFWRDLGDLGKRVLALDIPLTYAPKPFPGVEISGWATHELLAPPASYPPSIMDWVAERYGSPPRAEEVYRLMAPKELLQTRDQLIEMTGKVAALGAGLADKEDWDLLLLCFSATHRGGHKLWNLDGVAGDPSEEERSALAGSLREVYVACDRAIGDLLNAIGSDVTTVVFSLHGMGPNTCRSDLLPEFLRRILATNTEPAPLSLRKRLALRLRDAVPLRVRNTVKARLPMALQDLLTAFWRTGGIDWASTRAFALASDLQGYIRINLRGREAEGIVEEGSEYDSLCALISDGLRTFVDSDTGQPLVEDIARCADIFPSGQRLNDLPDLVVRWNSTPSSRHEQIVSDRYGSVPWPSPGRHLSGRSGNHRPTGFVLAAGKGIPDGSVRADAHILDLMPTAYHLLGLPIPEGLAGRPLFLNQPDETHGID